jgi:hypothetical protein
MILSGRKFSLGCVTLTTGKSAVPKPKAQKITKGESRGRLKSSARQAVHTLKLSPQEQLALELGLANLKPPATSLSE